MKMKYDLISGTPYGGCGHEGGDMMEKGKLLQGAVDAGNEGAGLMGLEEVRAALAEKANDGHIAGVKALIRMRGAARLSEVDPAEYPALLEDAEAL
ncbi:MAG: hypothetical protein NC311_15505 [Muribaculaceae bacterium]|nr:hypothetical protein [Muribaculaceae bacterium]